MKRGKTLAVVLVTVTIAVGNLGMTALASEDSRQSADAETVAENVYEDVQEAVQNIDRDSLKENIKEAMVELDEMGISPSAIAWDVFGIDSGYSAAQSIGEDLISEAQGVIEETSENFVQDIFDSVMSGIGDIASSLVDVVKEKIVGEL